jgi:hypothetical protein
MHIVRLAAADSMPDADSLDFYALAVNQHNPYVEILISWICHGISCKAILRNIAVNQNSGDIHRRRGENSLSMSELLIAP